MNTFGDRLRRYRVAEGITQEQLGFRLGVTKGAVSAWENNHDVPSFGALKRLRKEFRWSLDELMTDPSPDKIKADAIRGVMEKVVGYELPAEDIGRAKDSRELALLLRYRTMSSKRQSGLLDLLLTDAKKPAE